MLILPRSADYSEEVWMEIREKAVSILHTFFSEGFIPKNALSDEEDEESEIGYETEQFDKIGRESSLQLTVSEQVPDDVYPSPQNQPNASITESKEFSSQREVSDLSQATASRFEGKRSRSGKKAKKRHARQKSIQKAGEPSSLEKESTSYREDDAAMSGTDQVLSSSSRFASPEDSRSRKIPSEAIQELSSEHLLTSSPSLNKNSVGQLKDGFIIALHARDQ